MIFVVYGVSNFGLLSLPLSYPLSISLEQHDFKNSSLCPHFVPVFGVLGGLFRGTLSGMVNCHEELSEMSSIKYDL